MDKVHQKIWDLALKYQDLRNDKGHAKTVVTYSIKLIDRIKKNPTYLVKPNPDIVIPAATLHDIGWAKIPEEIRAYAGAKTPEEDRVRRLRHEKEGKEDGIKILDKVGYDKDLSENIGKIIDGHDTRTETFSVEDSVVRDADKLWRFSDTGFWIAIRNLDIPPQQEYAKLERQIDEEGFFFTEEARTMARKELKQRAKEIEEKRKEAC